MIAMRCGQSSGCTPWPGSPAVAPHEMLSGLGRAIVVGFVLKTVQAWTRVSGLSGALPSLLAGSWLLGRLLLAFGAGLITVITSLAGEHGAPHPYYRCGRV